MTEEKRVTPEPAAQAAGRDAIYELDGRISVQKAVPFGLQHVLAMFVANIATRVGDDPVGAALRARLRCIERTPPPGLAECRLPGAELARLRSRPDWIQALARRTGVTTSFVEER